MRQHILYGAGFRNCEERGGLGSTVSRKPEALKAIKNFPVARVAAAS